MNIQSLIELYERYPEETTTKFGMKLHEFRILVVLLTKLKNKYPGKPQFIYINNDEGFIYQVSDYLHKLWELAKYTLDAEQVLEINKLINYTIRKLHLPTIEYSEDSEDSDYEHDYE